MRIRNVFAGLAATAALLLSSCAPFPYDEGLTGSPTEPIEETFKLPTPQHLYNLSHSPDRSTFPASDVRVPGIVDAPEGSGYSRYFNQQVTWEPCGGTFECTTILAPLDWYAPDGLAITLALKRSPASESPRLGTLFINPGGPGGSAQDYVDSYAAAQGLGQYDIVGLDPRGSGESTPAVCGTTAETDAYYALDDSPDDDAERQALIDGSREFARQCRENSGTLLDHISTIEAIYDFDMVRQLLGDEKFNFHGVSYGTYLGSVYAELYPENVGYMVLDAAVNITDRPGVSQADGFEFALNEWAKWYAQNSASKALGATPEAVIATLTNWLMELDANPIPVGDRLLTQSLGVTGLALYFYFGAEYYDTMTRTIEHTIASGDGRYVLSAADGLNGRGPTGWDSSGFSFPAIACLDGADDGIEGAWVKWEETSARAPFFGTFLGVGIRCVVWSTRPAPQIDFSGAGAPPIVVIGGTGDNATPYQYAEWMAAELESGVLVTRNGVGHGSFDAGSSCIDKLVVDYLVNGTVPTNGTVCEMD